MTGERYNLKHLVFGVELCREPCPPNRICRCAEMNAWLTRHRGYLFVVLLNLIAWGMVTSLQRRPTAGLVEILPPPTLTPAPTSTPATVTVYVSGAVVHPDVYTLPDGSRVKQAIEAAGGFTADALQAGLNLAQLLLDGQQIHVPSRSEARTASVSSVATDAKSALESTAAEPQAPLPASSAGNRININTATAEELATLPRIGPALAQRIIEYRETHGGFQTIEELLEVRGIGEATLEQLQDLITVR